MSVARFHQTPSLISSDHLKAFSPAVSAALREKLKATPRSGRSAVLLAALPQLAADHSDAGARLLFDLASGTVEGVSRDAVLEYVRVAPASVVVRAFRLARTKWNFNLSALASRLSHYDVLDDLDQVRSARGNPRDYLYTTGFTHLLFLVAAGNGRDFSEPIHRKIGDETLLLLGASPYPDYLLRELSTVSFYPAPTPSYDPIIAKWCLGNPHHSKSSKEYAVSLLAAPCLAELCSTGVLGLNDVRVWVQSKRSTQFDPQIQLALTLVDHPGAAQLCSRLLRMIPNGPAYVLTLSAADKARVLTELYGDMSPLVLEYVESLSARWTRSIADLVTTARRLAAASHAST